MITNLKKLFVLTNWEMYIEQYGEYAYLLSNCTKQSTNNARIECKYPVILPNMYRKSYEPARAFRDLWARVMF